MLMYKNLTYFLNHGLYFSLHLTHINHIYIFSSKKIFFFTGIIFIYYIIYFVKKYNILFIFIYTKLFMCHRTASIVTKHGFVMARRGQALYCCLRRGRWRCRGAHCHLRRSRYSAEALRHRPPPALPRRRHCRQHCFW